VLFSPDADETSLAAGFYLRNIVGAKHDAELIRQVEPKASLVRNYIVCRMRTVTMAHRTFKQ
jgi:hypothetical protein